MFDRRHSSDYDDFAYATIEEVDELLPKAKSFISEIESLLWCYADTALVDIPRDNVELDCGEEGEVNNRGRVARTPIEHAAVGGLTWGKTLWRVYSLSGTKDSPMSHLKFKFALGIIGHC